jgi:hypothetical protein
MERSREAWYAPSRSRPGGCDADSRRTKVATDPLLVTLQIERLTCHDDGGVGRAEPYLLAAFFKIDADTVSLRDNGSLAGRATFQAEDRPTHGNLGVKRLGSGENTPVPPRLGRFETRLRAIPVPPKVPRKKVGEVLGVVGMMYVLMEFDGSSETGADSAHRDFNAALRRTLDDTVRTATVVEGSLDLDEQRLRAFEEDLKIRLSRAIVKAQGPVADLISVLNADDFIGSKIAVLTHRELLSKPSQRLDETFSRHGKWEVAARVRAG